MYNKGDEEHLLHLKQVFESLRAQKIYREQEKCSFMVDKLVFLGYVVSVDQTKIEAIRSWPTPTNISKMRFFHGLASFTGGSSVTSVPSQVISQVV